MSLVLTTKAFASLFPRHAQPNARPRPGGLLGFRGQAKALISSFETGLALGNRPAVRNCVTFALGGLASEAEALKEVPLTERLQPGKITRVFSPDELEEVLKMAGPDKVVVVQCKAKSCRPCMAFTKKYWRIADAHPEIIFLELYGDENRETRKLMMQYRVKATPTFRIYRGEEFLDDVVGISEKKVEGAIMSSANGGDVDGESDEDADTIGATNSASNGAH